MARFKGNNNLKTIMLMVERARYSKFAFPENNGRGMPGIKDFNRWEMTKFGRINNSGNAIIPMAKNIKPLLATTGVIETFSALNFVADAFHDMKKHIKRAYQRGILREDHPFLTAFAPRRAYESPLALYENYVSQMGDTYNYSFLSDKFFSDRIRNFGDYVHHFLDFIRISSDMKPLTLTGWHRSRHSSIYTSGLAIDIAGEDLSVDSFKDEFFIDIPEFSYYFKLAKYYGFLINKNAPFMLVADVNSPVMETYIQNNGFTSGESAINLAFMPTYQFDIERIQSFMIRYYNLYVASAPYIRKTSFCPNGKAKNTLRARNVTTAELVRKKYSSRYFLNFYIELRNIEEQSPFKEADIRRIKQKAGFFYRRYNPRSALDYVNEQFRSLYAAKEGTLHHWKEQQKMKK